jgi:hypothetical protein
MERCSSTGRLPDFDGSRLGTFGGQTELVNRLRKGGFQARGLFLEKDILKGVVLAAHEVNVGQLPQKSQKSVPQIEVDTGFQGITGIPFGSSAPVVIRGHNFEVGFPIEVLLDGRRVAVDQKLGITEKGDFTVSIKPVLNVGGHTILVRQETTRRVIQEAFTFNVVVTDSSR